MVYRRYLVGPDVRRRAAVGQVLPRMRERGNLEKGEPCEPDDNLCELPSDLRRSERESMSDYRQALKGLTKDERIVVAHLEELIGDMKAVRVATLFKGQEAVIATSIEKEVMAHLMPHFVNEIAKERSKIDLERTEIHAAIRSWQQTQKRLEEVMAEFQRNLEILKHIKVLAKEGKAEVILPEEAKA